jgi:hypothetical protein
MQGFFAALDEFKASGADAAAQGVRNPSHPAAFAAGLQAAAESTPILQKHGFKDATDFQRVGYNAAMAYTILQQGGKDAMAEKVKKAEAEQAKVLEKLKGQVSAEQYASLEQQLNTAMGAARSTKDVPDSNIELVKKYRERMENLGKK